MSFNFEEPTWSRWWVLRCLSFKFGRHVCTVDLCHCHLCAHVRLFACLYCIIFAFTVLLI